MGQKLLDFSFSPVIVATFSYKFYTLNVATIKGQG